MKKLTLLLSLLSFTLAYAETERPEDLCDMTYGCTENMRALSQEFAQGDIAFANKEASAFSGGCYHLDDNYYPDYEHHGVYVFKKMGDELYTNGMFLFFYNQDPYQGMNIQEVFSALGGGSFKTKVENNSVKLEFPGEDSNISYWFRSVEAGKKMILIGKEVGIDYSKLVFCKFDAHQD